MSAGSTSSRFWIPRWVLERSWLVLRQDGLKGVESTVTWGGIRFGGDAVIMSLIYPCGRDVELHPGLISVGPDTTAEMGRWLRGHGQAGLIQVHSHPGAWTGHSATDSDFSVASSEGFVSLVWPDFARRPVDQPTDFGVHRLRGGRWTELKGTEVTALLRFVESEALIWAKAPEPDHDEMGTGRRSR